MIRAARTWFEGSHHLRQCIFDIVQQWDGIAPGVPLPLDIDQDEWERHKASFPSRQKYDARVEQLREELSLDPDGWVSNEKYEATKEQSKWLESKWDEDMEGGPYPFQDGAPSWFVNS